MDKRFLSSIARCSYQEIIRNPSAVNNLFVAVLYYSLTFIRERNNMQYKLYKLNQVTWSSRCLYFQRSIFVIVTNRTEDATNEFFVGVSRHYEAENGLRKRSADEDHTYVAGVVEQVKNAVFLKSIS